MTASDSPDDGKFRGDHGKFAPDPATTSRDAKALALRTAHKTYAEIAEELGYANESGSYKAVQRALKLTVQEPADEVRKLELSRLDRLAIRALVILEKGIDDTVELQALDRLMKIQERRARLLGLDAPQRYSVDAAQLGDEIKELLGLMGRSEGSDEPAADGADDE